MTMQADADFGPDSPPPKLFSAVLRPHRALSHKAFLVLMGLVGSVSLAAGLAFWLLGASPAGFVTFGGTLGFFAGLFAWWLLAVLAGALYAAWVFPWESLAIKALRRK